MYFRAMNQFLHEKIDNLKLKWLKLIYTILYFKLCLVVACLYLFKYSSNYTKQVDLSALNLNELHDLVELRGMQNEEVKNRNYFNRSNLEELISNTGLVYQSELDDLNLITKSAPLNHQDFKSASEFLESIEDRFEDLWLVHIVAHQDNLDAKNTCENKTKFLNSKTLQKLNGLMLKIPIQVGTFDCEKDLNFCKSRGWDKPQLILGLAKNDFNKEFVELFNYSNCQANKYENIFNWLELMLRNHLKNKALKQKISKETYLKLFYVQKSTTIKKLPLYYSSLSVKHSRRANFYAIPFDKVVKPFKLIKKFQDEASFFLETCFDNNAMLFEKHIAQSKTPIYILIGNKICYNYGSNLNESPNYAHLNHFLFFLHPDLNIIFLFSFIFLNSYLILFIFEYNRSSFKQFLRGIFYLFCFNLLTGTLYIFTVNTFQTTRMGKSTLLQYLFSIFQFSFMKNELTQTISAHLRFFIYYSVYIQSHLSIVIYLFVALTFYFHTRFIYFKAKKLNKKIIQQKKLQLAKNPLPAKETSSTQILSTILLASQPLEHPLTAIQNISQRESLVESSPSLANTNALPVDLDLEIGVYDLINQINGLTTIWLCTNSNADRLLAELPTIEFCRCFYAHTIKIKAMDETDRDTTTEDDEEYSSSKLINSGASFCECEKNKELRKYFEEKNFRSKVRRECSICLDKYKIGSLLVLLPCGHLFHKRCVHEWFMNSKSCKCPICRTTHYKFNKNF